MYTELFYCVGVNGREGNAGLTDKLKNIIIIYILIIYSFKNGFQIAFGGSLVLDEWGGGCRLFYMKRGQCLELNAKETSNLCLHSLE